jgi:hypothetical protein
MRFVGDWAERSARGLGRRLADLDADAPDDAFGDDAAGALDDAHATSDARDGEGRRRDRPVTRQG